MPPTTQPPTKDNLTHAYGILQTFVLSVLEAVYQTRKTVCDHTTNADEQRIISGKL